jgi:hypothetical protein
VIDPTELLERMRLQHKKGLDTIATKRILKEAEDTIVELMRLYAETQQESGVAELARIKAEIELLHWHQLNL